MRYLERFADWGDKWHELFTSDESYFVPRPQYHFPTEQNWPSFSNLTMLVDAANRMPPYAGEGANMAMLDALELVEQLISTEFSDINATISTYETAMRKRSAEITEVTLESMNNMHSKNALSLVVNTFRQMNGGT